VEIATQNFAFRHLLGPEMARELFQSMPKYAKPVIASLFCGIVGTFIPQVLFFGYETLNGLFLNNELPTEYLLLLLVAKLLTTAVSASSKCEETRLNALLCFMNLHHMRSFDQVDWLEAHSHQAYFWVAFWEQASIMLPAES
jgi:hypothetical protein